MALDRRELLALIPAAAACSALTGDARSAAPRRAEGCVFCEIIAGETDSTIIYRDRHAIAFADIAPLQRGHVLVAPLSHYRTIYDLPESVAAPLFATVARVAREMWEVFRPDGLSLLQNNEAAAGQEIPHLHIHLIPRTEGVPLFETVARRERPGRSVLDETFAPLAARLRSGFP